MTIAPFNVETESLEDGVRVLSITGELDQATAAALREPLHEAIESGAGAVMIDMSDCGFIDSTGLGVIVEAWKDASGAQRQAEPRFRSAARSRRSSGCSR